MNVSVNFSSMADNYENIAATVGKIGNQVSAVKQTRNRGIYVGKSSAQIRQKIGSILDDLEQEKVLLGTMKTKLNDITVTYRNCEQQLSNGDRLATDENSTKTDTTTSALAESDNSSNPFDWYKLLIDVVGETGILGRIVSGGMSWESEDDLVKKLLKAAKNVTKIIGDGASAVNEGGTVVDWARSILGLTKPLEDVDKSGFIDGVISSLDDQLGKLEIGTAETVASKTKVVTKWLGNLLTFATNAYENCEEMVEDGISAERAIAETFVETAVDIGSGMLATALVSGAAVALGFTGAPALVIGGISAGVVWAANGICKWATKKWGGEEKDLGELVADLACDLGEGVVSFTQEASKVVNDVAESAVEAVGNAVNDAVDTVKQGFNNFTSGLSTAWSGFCGAFA